METLPGDPVETLTDPKRPVDHHDVCQECQQTIRVYTKRRFVLCPTCTSQKFADRQSCAA